VECSRACLPIQDMAEGQISAGAGAGVGALSSRWCSGQRRRGHLARGRIVGDPTLRDRMIACGAGLEAASKSSLQVEINARTRSGKAGIELENANSCRVSV
jgi:hypothetical protein